MQQLNVALSSLLPSLSPVIRLNKLECLRGKNLFSLNRSKNGRRILIDDAILCVIDYMD